MALEVNYNLEEEEIDGMDFLKNSEGIKRVRVKDNTAKANLLTISPELIFGKGCEWKEYDCIEERKNFVYLDKKRTDKVDSISYTCNTKNGNIMFKSLNPRLLFSEGFFDDDLEESEENVRIRVPVGQAKITIWKVEFGVAHLSITVPFVERM